MVCFCCCLLACSAVDLCVFVCLSVLNLFADTLLSLATDAPPPFVGSYPYRSSAGGVTAASQAVTREQGAQKSVATNLALHYAAPAIADDDATVLQGLRYPQRYVLFDARLWSAGLCTQRNTRRTPMTWRVSPDINQNHIASARSIPCYAQTLDYFLCIDGVADPFTAAFGTNRFMYK